MKCELCETEIIDQGEIPAYVSVTGWTLDEDSSPYLQYSINVCRDCFINRNNEVLQRLEKNEGEYE